MTQLYSDVASLPDARSAVPLSVGWRGLGPRDQDKRTRREPLRGYVLVDYTVVQQQQQESINIMEHTT